MRASTKVEPGKMTVEEVNEDGAVRKTARTAVRLFDDAARVPRRRCGHAASKD